MINNKKITDSNCNKWKLNKLVNPITNRNILFNGPVYKNLKKNCIHIKSPIPTIINNDIKINKKTILKRELTLEDCIKWNKNKLKNPITNYTINEKSKIYKELNDKCIKLLNIPIKKSSPKINNNPISPKINNPIINNPISSPKIINNDHLYFPDINDPNFREKLSNLFEFNMYKIKEFDKLNSIDDFNLYSNKFCGYFEKAYYQYFMNQYISNRSPYKSILIYHGVGVGKTCSAITIAEGFLNNHSLYDEPIIWVIMPQALKESFKKQVFDISKNSQCTDDLYSNLINIDKNLSTDKINLRTKKLINSRYRIFTDNSFSDFIEKEYFSTNKTVKDKIIIIDEAHNIRLNDNNDKKIYNTLVNVIKNGFNNRLVLLTATPMYNEPTDIFDLFYLLLLNDKREHLLSLPYPKIFDNNNNIIPKDIELIKKLVSNYISYLRGKNPFSFALKLNPQHNDIPILNKEIPLLNNGLPIPDNDKNWLKKVNDGIIPTLLGEYQLNYLKKKSKTSQISEDKENVFFTSLQPMNIVYFDDIKFYNIFRRINENLPIEVEYIKKYNNLLLPDENHLGKCSGKFLKMANIINNSKGIVVIYSRFIWNGILPFSIVLEHLGYTREGASNFLSNPTIINKNKNNYKYCILSSKDPEIMGNSNFNQLINIINSPNNIDGSLIKVILMTPVAGEGLSFNNVREIHLIEPWFHFNRVDQVIGRGIRNCSHQNLPITDKNVSVFMYASIENYNKESADIHAYRISSRKIYQSNIIDKIIRNNAIDCLLFKNINFFPKKLFENMGKLKLNTSQGKKIEVELGDDDDIEPECNININNNLDYRGFRKETFSNLTSNIKLKLKKLILSHIDKGSNFLTIKDINKEFIDINKKIIFDAIQQSIYPNTLIDNYTIIPHEEGLHIIKIINDIPNKIRIFSDSIPPPPIIEDKSSNKQHIIKFNNNQLSNINSAIIALYSSLDSDTYKLIVRNIIESDNLNETDLYISKCLYLSGALIANKELPSIKHITKKFIGYINIFNEEFEPNIYIGNGNYKDFNEIQKAELINIRKKINIPNMNQESLEWGLFIPTLIDKNNKNLLKNVFKLLTPGVAYGKKTGIVCTSLRKENHSDIFKRLKIDDSNKNTKNTYCNSIAIELLNINRILLYPIYKPTIII